MIWEFFIIKSRIKRLVEGKFSDSDIRVLDVGCGENPYYHKNIRGNVVCFDARKTKANQIIGDADSLPFKDKSFDSVISINSFYYFKDPFKSEKEIARVLNKNGELFLLMPFIYPVHDAPHDKYRFTLHGIEAILKEDFAIKEATSIGGIFTLPSVFFHSLIKGMKFVFPKNLRVLSIPFLVLLIPLYIISQLLSLLDFLDSSKRWATYYFVFAVRK